MSASNRPTKCHRPAHAGVVRPPTGGVSRAIRIGPLPARDHRNGRCASPRQYLWSGGVPGDRRNLVIPVKALEKPVDVKFALTFGKSDMLVRRDVLITQENKSVFNEVKRQLVKCA